MLDSLFSVGWYFVFVRLESVCVLGSGGFEGGGGLASCVNTETEYHCKK